jgi:hypothetical protein
MSSLDLEADAGAEGTGSGAKEGTMNAQSLPPDPIAPLALTGAEIDDARRRMPTARQQQYLDFIARYISEHGYPPTLREIGAELGIRSTNGVNDGLLALEKKGWLKRDLMRSRGIVLAGGHSVPTPSASVDMWRAENVALRRLLERARDAFYRMPHLTAEATQVAGDIREVLKTRGGA